MRLKGHFNPLIRFFKYFSYQTYYVEGDGGHLKAEKNTRLANALFNVESGDISIGENTIFGYNVMVLTGKHNFKNGMRISIYIIRQKESFLELEMRSHEKDMISILERIVGLHLDQ